MSYCPLESHKLLSTVFPPKIIKPVRNSCLWTIMSPWWLDLITRPSFIACVLFHQNNGQVKPRLLWYMKLFFFCHCQCVQAGLILRQGYVPEKCRTHWTQNSHVNKKVQLDATVCRHLFTAQSLNMFRVSQHPSSGVLKTVSATSGIGHDTGTATSFQRGLIRPRWK